MSHKYVVRVKVAGKAYAEPIRTKAKSIDFAQWVCDRNGASAEIVRNGAVIMRYWRDSVGLHYIEY